MKKYHCAQCGMELKVMQKPIPSKGVVLNLVEPHSCEGTKPVFEVAGAETGRATGPAGQSNVAEVDKGVRSKVDNLFDSFSFVQKLNKETKEVEPMSSEPSDRRPKSSMREELVTSSAPLGVLDRAKQDAGLTSPVRDMEEPEGE